MPTALVLLIRHGQSTWNAAGRWQGHGDPPLSAEGQGQGRALARTLDESGARFDTLLSSDLLRARQSAEILGEVLSLEVQPDARLRERDAGSWAGLTRAEIAERFPESYARFRAGDRDVRLGGGETPREVERRVRDALTDLVARFAGQRLALVTHRGVTDVLAPGSSLDNAETAWLPRDPEGSGAGSAAKA